MEKKVSMYLSVVKHESLKVFLFETGCTLALQRYAESRMSPCTFPMQPSIAMQVPAQRISKVTKSQPANTSPRSVAFQAAPFAEAETTFVTFGEAEAPAATIGELAALSPRAVGDARLIKEGLLVIKKPC